MNKYIFTVEIEAEALTQEAFGKAFNLLEDQEDEDFESKFTVLDVTNNRLIKGSELREILGV